MNYPVKVGVVGAGYAARLHLSAIKAIDPVIPIWIYDIDEDKAASCASEFDCFVAKSVKELCDCIDCAIISTPSSTHWQLASSIIRAGKHILCEKPLADDAIHAREMVAISNRKHLMCFIGYNYRFFELTDIIIREFSTEPIESITLSLFRLFRNESYLETSVLADLGSHLVDYVQYISGQDIDLSSFAATGLKEQTSGKDYQVRIIGATVGGTRYSIHVGRTREVQDVHFALSIKGKERDCHFDSRQGGSFFISFEGDRREYRLHSPSAQFDFFDFTPSIFSQDSAWIKGILSSSPNNRLASFEGGLKVQYCIDSFLSSINSIS